MSDLAKLRVLRAGGKATKEDLLEEIRLRRQERREGRHRRRSRSRSRSPPTLRQRRSQSRSRGHGRSRSVSPLRASSASGRRGRISRSRSQSPRRTSASSSSNPTTARSPVGMNIWGGSSNTSRTPLEDVIVRTAENFNPRNATNLELARVSRGTILAVPAYQVSSGSFSELDLQDRNVSMLCYEVTDVDKSRDTLDLEVKYRGRTAGITSIHTSSSASSRRSYDVPKDVGTKIELSFRLRSSDMPKFLVFTSRQSKAVLAELNRGSQQKQSPGGRGDRSRGRDRSPSADRRRARDKSRSRSRDRNQERDSRTSGNPRERKDDTRRSHTDGQGKTSSNLSPISKGIGNPHGTVSFLPQPAPISDYPIRGPAPPSTLPASSSANPFFRVTSQTSLPSQYSTSHYPCQDHQQSVEFPMINLLKISSQEAIDNDRKIKETAISRILVSPDMITMIFGGKGLDFLPRQKLVDYYLHQTSQQGGSRPTDAWDRVSASSEYYVKASTSPILSADDAYFNFQTVGLQLDLASDSKLSKSSCTLAHFLPETMRFDENTVCQNHQSSLVLKGQLSLVFLCVEYVHVLLRNPFIFLHTFTYVSEALQNPSHDLCKDVFTVPALVWFFSILLAKFYREVKYYHGLGSPRFFRTLLLDKVIHPFLNIQESVATRHAILCLGEAPKDHRGAVTRNAAKKSEVPSDVAPVSDTVTTPKSSGKSPTVASKTVCKYWLAEYLKVAWPNTTTTPVCTNASPCAICPHQDFKSYTKADMLIFVNKCKHEFVSHSTWSVMHDLCLEAVGNLM